MVRPQLFVWVELRYGFIFQFWWSSNGERSLIVIGKAAPFSEPDPAKPGRKRVEHRHKLKSRF
jgi:hypothetical protein